MKNISGLTLTLLAILLSSCAVVEQKVAKDFEPQNQTRTFTSKNPPVIGIDSAHYNFHTLSNRYKPFAKVLQSDGLTVIDHNKKFRDESLKALDVLVISNALNKENVDDWDLPNYSAFSREEIEAVYRWVNNGGSLFLIADHMPFPKAAESLAAIFGFQFNNGYAQFNPELENDLFSLSNGGLKAHSILKGMNDKQAITSIETFTGQAFLIPPTAKPVLIFNQPAESLMPSESWQLDEDTLKIPIDGWAQGATLEFGKGRIYVSGEAAMFTAQYSNRSDKWFGMGSAMAPQNEQFLLNIIHWLTRKI